MAHQCGTAGRCRPAGLLILPLLLLTALASTLASGAWLPVWACEGVPGRGPFNIQGAVLDEAGQPVAGLQLRWLPVLPGREQPDLENLYYGIEGRPDHPVVTDEHGRFELTGVLDYFTVGTHRYVVWGADVLANPPRNVYWRVTGGNVDLSRTPPATLTVQLTARSAGAVRVRVLHQDGAPFDGILPVTFGLTGKEDDGLALTCTFVNGEYLQGGLEPGRTRVGLLAGASVEEIKFRNYVAVLAQPRPAPVVQVRGEDVLLQAETTVVAAEVREVTFTLPDGYRGESAK